MANHQAGAPADRPPAPGPADAAARAANDTVFDALLALVRRDTGVDVTQYREATLRRRVDRRRRLLNLPDDEAYLVYLRDHPEEAHALQRSFLISVTSFFRDAPAFAALRAALRRTVDEKPLDQPLRVWVPACATGEEAYSVAIVLLECLAGRSRMPEIKVFATDLDAAAVAVAQQGRYDASELDGLDPALRERYFRRAGADEHVSVAVRRLLRKEVCRGPACLLPHRRCRPHSGARTVILGRLRLPNPLLEDAPRRSPNLRYTILS